MGIPERIPRRFYMPFAGSIKHSPDWPSVNVVWYTALIESVEQARQIYFDQVLPILPSDHLLMPTTIQLWILKPMRVGERGVVNGGISRIGAKTFDWCAEVSRFHTEDPVAYVAVTFALLDARTGNPLPLPTTFEERVVAFEGPDDVEIGGE